MFEFAVGYGYDDALSDRDQRAGLEPCAAGDNVHRRPAVCVYPCNIPGGLSCGKNFAHSDWPVAGSVGCADWSCMDGAVDISPGGFWIDYIWPGLEDGQSIVAAPVTGSLVSSTLFRCRDVYDSARSALILTFCGTDWVLPAGYQVLLQKISERWAMNADGLSVVDNRAGVTLGVEHCMSHGMLRRR